MTGKGITGSFRTSNLRVQEPRLERALNVSYFVLPPVAAESKKEEKDLRQNLSMPFDSHTAVSPDVTGLHHKKNGVMIPQELSGIVNDLPAVNPGGKKVFVYPVRFIMACENGHLDEFHGKTGLDTNQIVPSMEDP